MQDLPTEGTSSPIKETFRSKTLLDSRMYHLSRNFTCCLTNHRRILSINYIKNEDQPKRTVCVLTSNNSQREKIFEEADRSCRAPLSSGTRSP